MIFNAYDLKQFSLDISDRNIYNDIRSETDITETTEIQGDGTSAEYEDIKIDKDGSLGVLIAANSTADVTFTVEDGHTHITWLSTDVYWANRTREQWWSESECEAEDGKWYAPAQHGYPSTCLFPNIAGTIDIRFITRGKTTAKARITNPYNYEIGANPSAIYRYLAQEAIAGPITIETETRTLTVRSVNETSIKKYGRRVMNLVWPLGQTQEQTQSLTDSYRDRYCESVCFASMTLEGSTDAKITQILGMDIDDKHEFIHPRLDMDKEFFVNNLNVTLNREGTGLLTATFGLEQVRDMEGLTFFIIGTSLIGGAHVIAP